jgi:hypothetical protein
MVQLPKPIAGAHLGPRRSHAGGNPGGRSPASGA